MEPYLDEEDTEDIILDNVRERHRRMVFNYKYGGVDDDKTVPNSKRRDVYMND